ncbi:HIT domain-containing protein [Pseudomonas sp. KNUC1026]|uniref:HIT domain-containing protein n=1 Tax=Pseudomonas sp. KNUC1026 TaxID=2893890 RepID=UPI001F3E179F|nr:HIT domain-containing protein [Pseudomonas sp. KNUC1026]UFH50355.1 HIT domain-containing protein [Pseudomonas sp. KNUC1026]
MFSLDPRLQNDTLHLGDLPLCRLLLSNDSQYPWFILVPRVAGVSEVFDLSAADQQALWNESSWLGEVVKAAFAARKVNIATLGNVVSQLHMHVIARFAEDPAWPGPVWGKLPARPYAPEEVEQLCERLKAQADGRIEWVQA